MGSSQSGNRGEKHNETHVPDAYWSIDQFPESSWRYSKNDARRSSFLRMSTSSLMRSTRGAPDLHLPSYFHHVSDWSKRRAVKWFPPIYMTAWRVYIWRSCWRPKTRRGEGRMGDTGSLSSIHNHIVSGIERDSTLSGPEQVEQRLCQGSCEKRWMYRLSAICNGRSVPMSSSLRYPSSN